MTLFLKVFEIPKNFFQKVLRRVKGRALARLLPDKSKFEALITAMIFCIIEGDKIGMRLFIASLGICLNSREQH